MSTVSFTPWENCWRQQGEKRWEEQEMNSGRRADKFLSVCRPYFTIAACVSALSLAVARSDGAAFVGVFACCGRWCSSLLWCATSNSYYCICHFCSWKYLITSIDTFWSSWIMSSGIGVKGTVGRCYPFYADLRKCVVSSLLSFRSKLVRRMGRLLSGSGAFSLPPSTRLITIALDCCCLEGKFVTPSCVVGLYFDSPIGLSWFVGAWIHSQRNTKKVPRQCVGKKTKIILNASTDSRRRQEF